jgi:hypothetical protein
MPRRRRRFDPVLLPASAALRRGLRELREALTDVAADGRTDDVVGGALRAGLSWLEPEVRIAIVLLDELDAPPLPLATARERALDVLHRIDGVIATAYEDRRAPVRGLYAACYAVAQLATALYAIPIVITRSRWN